MWLRVSGLIGLATISGVLAWWAKDSLAQPPGDELGPSRAERDDRPGDPPPPDRRPGHDRGDFAPGRPGEHGRAGERGHDGELPAPPRGGRPPRGGEGDDRRPHPPRPNKLVKAIDSDHDGVISATELKEATAALTKLDSDGDGALTADEFELPPPPPPRDRSGPPREDRRGPPPGENRGAHRGPPPPRGAYDRQRPSDR